MATRAADDFDFIYERLRGLREDYIAVADVEWWTHPIRQSTIFRPLTERAKRAFAYYQESSETPGTYGFASKTECHHLGPDFQELTFVQVEV